MTRTAAVVGPAWDLAAATSRRAEVAKGIGAAAKAGNRVAGTAFLAGAERVAYVAAFDYADRYGEDRPTDRWRGDTISGLWTTPNTSYPQHAFIWVKLKAKAPEVTQLLEVWMRSGAAAPWLRTATAFIDESVAWPAPGSVIGPVPTSINGLSLPRLPEFVTAVNDPDRQSDQRWKKNAEFRYKATWIADERKHDRNLQTVAANYTVSSDIWALPVKDSMVLVVPLELVSYWSLNADTTYSWGKPFNRYWKGKRYRSATYRDHVTLLLRVPTHGRIAIIGPANITPASITSR